MESKVANKNIYVTQPALPEIEEFIPYLKAIWDSKVLTNGGQFHQELEDKLKKYLDVNEISLFCNGTIALITALQVLGIKGEVITTPYSFVATSHALKWNNIEPVFVDIDPQTFNIDPRKIEAAITSNTTAILAVHCYGIPCDVDAIEKIASKYNLKVIYDAAHAFGVNCHCGKSLLTHGDLSVLSFHATKVFNTFEGGAIVSQNKEIKKLIDQLKNFGYVDELTVEVPGINGKMNEISAVMGLLQLQTVESAIFQRKLIDKRYRDAFKLKKGIRCAEFSQQIQSNYSYFPILVDEEFNLNRDDLYHKLKSKNIFSRRYFYPLISDFPMYQNLPSSSKENLPIASKISSQVLCLPIFPDLEVADQQSIINLIMEA
jgi:dTDP-4-amino-4,6-dideoxygalactose transaminase